MTILIIEDDPQHRKILFEILESMVGEVEVLGFTDSLDSTLNWFINHQEPDLIFLSTQFQDGPAANLFKEIRISSPLIFMSQDGKMALGTFKYNTLDYLIRPITKNAVISSLFKYRTFQNLFHKNGEPSLYLDEPTRSGKENLQKEFKKRFAIHIGDKIKSLDSSEIAYFMADGNVVFLFTLSSDRFTINNSLEDILEKLDPERFFRLNRTYIVQIKSIKETRKFFNGRLKVLLTPESEEEVFVSRNRVHEYLRWLGE